MKKSTIKTREGDLSREVALRLTTRLRNNFADYMRKNRISIAELARRMGKTRSTLCSVFSAEHIWTVTTIVEVCDALELDICFELTPRRIKL